MKRIALKLSTASLASLVPASAAWAQAGERYSYDHQHMMGAWGWFGGMLMMLLAIALIVGVVVITVRFLGHDQKTRSSNRALDLLNERFARGEIDRTEYEERRRALQDSESR